MTKCYNDPCTNEATYICYRCHKCHSCSKCGKCHKCEDYKDCDEPYVDGVYLCETCNQQIHPPGSKYERKHAPKKFDPRINDLKKRCPKHNKDLTHFIENEGIVVCSDCALEEYKGKPQRHISKVSAEKKDQLRKHQGELIQVRDRLENNLTYLENEREKEEENKEESIRELEKWKGDTLSMVEKIFKEHKEAVESYHREVHNDLEAKIDKTKADKANLCEEIKRIDGIIELWCDDKLVEHLGMLFPTINKGKELMEQGNATSTVAEETETRITFFKATTKEADVKRTTYIEYVETPNNVPHVNAIEQRSSKHTSIDIEWKPIEKVPEKLAREPLKYFVVLYNDSGEANPIQTVDVGRATGFTIKELTPATTYKVAIKSAFGSDPKLTSLSRKVEIRTADTLEPPEDVTVSSGPFSADVSWKAPRCLDGRPDLLSNVEYTVSLLPAKDGLSSSPLYKSVRNEFKATFEGLEIETSYKIEVKCKYGTKGKESVAVEKVFSTRKIQEQDYVSEFLEHRTITKDGNHKFRLNSGIEGDVKFGIGILKNPIGGHLNMVASFKIEKGGKPIIGIIPSSKVSEAGTKTDEKQIRNYAICFVYSLSKFLIKKHDLPEGKTLPEKINVESDYILSIGVNTHSREITLFHNGNSILTEKIPDEDPEFFENVHPYIVSNKPVELIPLKGPQQQQQQPQQPPQLQSQPQQPAVITPYNVQWFSNPLFKQLNGENTAVQKVGGEDLYGAITIGSKPFVPGNKYTFKVALSTADRRVRIGLAHQSSLTNNMNDPSVFTKNNVVYADLSENKVVDSNKPTPFENNVPSDLQKPFHVCMTVDTERRQVTFDFFSTGLVHLVTINLGSEINNYYPFVALSSSNSVAIEK